MGALIFMKKIKALLLCLGLLFCLSFTTATSGTLNLSNSQISGLVELNFFSPLSVSQLILWLDASDASTIVPNGNKVSQWNDKSGKGDNYTQSNPDLQPFYNEQINGLNVVTFDINKMEATFGAVKGSAYTFYFVVATTRTVGNNTILGNDSSGFNSIDYRIGMSIAGPNIGHLGLVRNDTAPNRFNQLEASIAMNDGNAHILALTFDGFDVSLRTDLTVDNFLATNIAGIFTGAQPGLGAGFNGVAQLKGKICEFILYEKTVTPVEDLRVVNYLIDKWGI